VPVPGEASAGPQEIFEIAVLASFLFFHFLEGSFALKVNLLCVILSVAKDLGGRGYPEILRHSVPQNDFRGKALEGIREVVPPSLT
jgi:hypothetical protein